MKMTDKELEKQIEEWCGQSKTNWKLVLLIGLTVLVAVLLLTCN
jgi:hypothetical protein